MQKTKRILSVLLAAFMLFSMMVPMVSAAADYSDVPTTHKYYKAITNLSVYGILNGFEDGTFRPEDGVTRAQFAKIICYALNVGEAAGKGPVETGFTDVDPNHWAAGNIKIATAMGIINGMGDGTFAPENPVLFEQAVKMVVCALGYGKVADQKGGYPHGHMSVASEIGILKNSDGKIEQAANRATIANLVDNMLNAKTVNSQTGEKGSSIREQSIKTISEDGQITAIYGSTILAGETSPCARNQIQLLSSGEYYTYSVVELDDVRDNISDYLGKRVTVYYSSDDELRTPVLTNLTLQANKNHTTVVDLADITDFSNTSVEYIEDYSTGDVEEVSVARDANILYNGVATTDDLDELIDTKKPGQITFLDSDNDDDADVVFIKEYTTMIVKSKASSTYKLYDEKDSKKDIVLDEEDKTASITIKKNGSASAFKNINTNDVVSYASSADGKVIDVLVSNKTVSNATISSYNATQRKVSLRTSGKDTEYKISPEFETYTDAVLEVGLTGKFFIDAFGKIVKADVTSETAYKYAYLTGFENVGTSTTPSYAIQVINIDGATAANEKIVNLASKFKIDSKSYSDSDDEFTVSSALVDAAITFNQTNDFADDEVTQYCQVIKYTTNSAGAIDRIITADYDADTTNNLKIDNTYLEKGAKCTTKGSKLESKFNVYNAKVLFVPEERKEDDDNKFIGYRASSFFNATKSYKVQLIDTTESYSVPIIIVYGTADDAKDTVWATITPSVVKSTNQEILESTGEVTTCLTVITTAGEEAKYYKGEDTKGSLVTDKDEAVDIDDVEPGDVVRIDATADGVVQEFKLVTTAADMKAASDSTAIIWGEGENKDTDYAEYRHIIGTAIDLTDNTLLLAPAFVKDGTLDEDDEKSISISGAKVIVVDSAKLNTENGVAVDVADEIIGFSDQPENASKILVYSAKEPAKLIVIFK